MCPNANNLKMLRNILLLWNVFFFLFFKPYPSLEGTTDRWERIPIRTSRMQWQLHPLASIRFRTCGRCCGDEHDITMAAIEIFSSSVTYKYKSRIHSCASIVVFLFIVLALVTPLFIIYNTGGKTRPDFRITGFRCARLFTIAYI